MDCSREGKAALRAEVLRRRDALPAASRRDWGLAILDRILGLDAFANARTVMVYSSIGSEFDTAPLLRAILEGGRVLLLPAVNRAADRLDVYEVQDLEGGLISGVWGIREPDPARCRERRASDADLIVAPGVAFDRHGGRIGHGKGYYDRLLAGCRPLPLIVSAAFEVQVVDRVPMEPHDVAINLLVTEGGIWRPAAGWRVEPGSQSTES